MLQFHASARVPPGVAPYERSVPRAQAQKRKDHFRIGGWAIRSVSAGSVPLGLTCL
jgi:hypothetical protein